MIVDRSPDRYRMGDIKATAVRPELRSGEADAALACFDYEALDGVRRGTGLLHLHAAVLGQQLRPVEIDRDVAALAELSEPLPRVAKAVVRRPGLAVAEGGDRRPHELSRDNRRGRVFEGGRQV